MLILELAGQNFHVDLTELSTKKIKIQNYLMGRFASFVSKHIYYLLASSDKASKI